MISRNLDKFSPYILYSEGLTFFKKNIARICSPESKKSSLSKRISRQILKVTGALAEALPDFVLRGKNDTKVEILLQSQEAAPEAPHHDTIKKFVQFDVHTKMPFETNPITPSQITKATHLASLNTPECALFEGLILKTKNPRSTRLDFTERDWKALDLVNFELIQENFTNLNNLFNSKKVVDKSNLLKERFGVDYYESLIAETFAKSLAHNRNYHGKKLEIPVLQQDGKYKLITFTISNLSLGDELPAYILESKEANVDPWIVIRGTESIQGKNAHGRELRQGSGESVIADCIDKKGIARDVVIKSLVNRPIVKDGNKLVERPSLYDTFEGWNAEGKKAKITGHSLGGYLAIDLTIHMFDFVRQAYAFNAPGVSKKQALSWDDKVAIESEQTGKPKEIVNSKVVQYNTEGDLVPTSGRKLIGLQLAVEPTKKFKKKDPLHDHLWIILSKNFAIQQIDTIKENQKFSRRIVETLRSSAGFTYRHLLTQKQPDWWINRKLYRTALEHRKVKAE